MRRISIAIGMLVVLALGSTSCDRSSKSAAGRASIDETRLQIGIAPGPLSGDEDVGRRAPMFKAGHWTPILVKIAGRDDLENAELVVQTVDSDDVLNTNTVSLGTVQFSAEAPSFTTVVYARPGKTDSTIAVTLKSKGQVVGQPVEKSLYALESNFFLYVTLGARLPGLRLPGLDDKQNRLSEIAAFDTATELPAKWYGYNTVDLAVLTTGNEKFTGEWLSDSGGARRDALLEWVRRGGQLVVCVGKNESLLKNRPELEEFLPVQFEGTATPDSIQVSWGTVVNDSLADPQKKSALTIAKMKPKLGRGARVLSSASSPENKNSSFPFVVQAAYGFGRVTVVAIDPELSPFNRWKSQGAFWERLLRDSGPAYVEVKPREQGIMTGISDSSTDDDASQLQRHVLENFDGVPIIPFGWVALFIFVYILIVGPLDYLFLKKVVKRLELTWVTFPLVVLIVSAAAYFTASAVKGNVQKINKVDLIDYDLRTKTVQGTTWFSIFSPQVQNYTLGVEPSEGWGAAREQISPPLVTWLGRARSGRQSLFRRSYDYDPSGGLRRVPIQVWSTKGFQGAWYHPMDAQQPPFVADLQRVANGEITGNIVSHLPVTLENVELYYKGHVYPLGRLVPGAAYRKQVTSLNKMSFPDRFKSNTGFDAAVPVGFNRTTPYDPPLPALAPAHKTIESVLFHEAIEHDRPKTTRNAMLRDFDQSWRVSLDSSGEDAILYAALPTQRDTTQGLNKSSATATRLWIGALPSDKGGTRSELGTMRQDAFVRVFIPVRIK